MATKNGPGFRSNTATFTRPTDTAVYTSGDLVANSITAASVVPLSWAFSGKSVFTVPAVKLETNNATITNGSFRVHIYLTTIPTIATTGDNGVYNSVVSGKGAWMGSFDGTLVGHADGGVALCVPTGAVIRPDILATPGDLIYGLIEARGAYVPANAEVITATLIQEFPRG